MRAPRPAEIPGLLLAAAAIVVACSTGSLEPYPYEDDDDAGMYGGEGGAGEGGGGTGGGSTGEPSGDADGDWEGTCHIDLSGYTYEFGLELGIETEEDGSLGGIGALLLYGYAYTGPLTGTLSGSDISLRFMSSSSGYGIDVELDGELDDGTMGGSCRVVGYPGTFKVSRS